MEVWGKYAARDSIGDSVVVVNRQVIGGGPEVFRMQRHGTLRPLLASSLSYSDLEPEPTLTDEDVRAASFPCRRLDLLSCVRLIVDTIPVFLMTTNNCTKCVQTKELLANLGVSVENGNLYLFELDTYHEKYPILMEFAVQNLAELANNHITMPALFVGGESFGGITKTRRMHEQGKLINKLKEAKVL